MNEEDSFQQQELEALQRAVRIYRLVPPGTHWKQDYFSQSHAMEMAGIANDLSKTQTYRDRFEKVLEGYRQKYGALSFAPLTEKDLKERSISMFELAKKLPGGKKQLAHFMRLVGCNEEQMNANAMRMSITRDARYQRANTTNGVNATASSTSLAPVSTVDLVSDVSSVSSSALSPLSLDGELLHLQTQGSSSVSDTTIASGSAASAASSAASTLSTLVSRPTTASSKEPSLSDLTSFPSHRKTSAQAQADRREQMEFSNLTNDAYKIGTILLDSVQSKRINLKHLDDSNKVADVINGMFKVELVTGNSLANGVKAGLVGKSPPRRGPPPTIPKDEFEALASLVFTCESIQQANCDESRLTRPQLISIVEDIVNDCLKRRGLEPLNGIKFYSKIQEHNSAKQDVIKVDPRDALRVLWLTYHNQKRNHEKFEEACVELGLARMPADEKERQSEGHVIFGDNQLSRILIYDEMPFHLDGMDQEISGRPAQSHSDPRLPETGEPGQKSGTTMTFMLGGNLALEAFPPYPMIPSSAKNPNCPVEYLRSLPQVEAQFGYPGRRHFDASWTFNEKGGMNNDAFCKWYCEVLMRYYPDAEDVPGKRVIDKSDSGPGRMGVEFNTRARSSGFYHFPSTPNCTEVCQEMDQLFAYLKMLAYKNANKVLVVKRELCGPSTILDPWEGIACFYGHPVRVVNTEGREAIVDDLEPAYDMAFSPEKMKRARDKVGYAPATRASLCSDKIRHEAVLDENGLPDDEEDAYASMLVELEKQHNAALEFLVSRDYLKAIFLKRSVATVTAAEVNSREASQAVRHTREYQDQLMAATSTAGKWYKATSGGEPTNSTDALFAMERKENKKKLKALESLKKKYITFAMHEEAGEELLAGSKEYDDWTKNDFISVIRWKQGLTPPLPGETNLSSKRVGDLRALWENKHRGAAPPRHEWTRDSEIERLKTGDISSLAETAIMQEAIRTENEYLQIRLETVSQSRQLAVLQGLLDGMPTERRTSFLSKLGFQEKDVTDTEEEGTENESDAHNALLALLPSSDDESTSEARNDSEGRCDSEKGSHSSDSELSSDDTSEDPNLLAIRRIPRRDVQRMFDEIGSDYEADDDERSESKVEQTPPRRSARARQAQRDDDGSSVYEYNLSDDSNEDEEKSVAASSRDTETADGVDDASARANTSEDAPDPHGPALRRSKRNRNKRSYD